MGTGILLMLVESMLVGEPSITAVTVNHCESLIGFRTKACRGLSKSEGKTVRVSVLGLSKYDYSQTADRFLSELVWSSLLFPF